MRSVRPPIRRGVTLLEVILAVAILGGALAVLGELFRMGMYSAREARESTYAQLHCESLMAQVAAGVLPADPVGSPAPLPALTAHAPDDRWRYTMVVDSLDENGLLQVTVTVIENAPENVRPIEYSLSSWIVDPEFLAALAAEVAAEAEAAAAEAEAAAAEASAAEADSGAAEGGGNAPTG